VATTDINILALKIYDVVINNSVNFLHVTHNSVVNCMS